MQRPGRCGTGVTVPTRARSAQRLACNRPTCTTVGGASSNSRAISDQGGEPPELRPIQTQVRPGGQQQQFLPRPEPGTAAERHLPPVNRDLDGQVKPVTFIIVGIPAGEGDDRRSSIS
jgi:hypothetical protein